MMEVLFDEALSTQISVLTGLNVTGFASLLSTLFMCQKGKRLACLLVEKKSKKNNPVWAGVTGWTYWLTCKIACYSSSIWMFKFLRGRVVDVNLNTSIKFLVLGHMVSRLLTLSFFIFHPKRKS